MSNFAVGDRAIASPQASQITVSFGKYPGHRAIPAALREALGGPNYLCADMATFFNATTAEDCLAASARLRSPLQL